MSETNKENQSDQLIREAQMLRERLRRAALSLDSFVADLAALTAELKHESEDPTDEH